MAGNNFNLDNEDDINELIGSAEEMQPLNVPDENRAIENEINDSEVFARDQEIKNLTDKLNQYKALRQPASPSEETFQMPEQRNELNGSEAQSKPPIAPPSQDRYADLLRQSKDAQKQALILGGITQMAQGIAGKNVPGYKPTSNLTEMLLKQAQQPLEDYASTQALEKADYGLKDTREARDANSRISKLYREYAKTKGLAIEDDMSAKDISDLLKLKSKGDTKDKTAQQSGYITLKGDPVIFNPNTGKYTNALNGQEVQSGDVRRNYMKTVVDPRTGEIVDVQPGYEPQNVTGPSKKIEQPPAKKEGTAAVTPTNPSEVYNKLNPKQRKDLEDLGKGFAEETKDSRDYTSQVSGIINQVDEATRNPNAAKAIGGVVAKLIESGRLTDQDTERYAGRAGILNGLKDSAILMGKGMISQDQANALKKSLRLMQKTAQLKNQTRAVEKAKNFSNAYGEYRPEDVAPFIYGDFQSQVVMREKKTGKLGKVPASFVNQAIKSGKYEVAD